MGGLDGDTVETDSDAYTQEGGESQLRGRPAWSSDGRIGGVAITETVPLAWQGKGS